MVNEIRKAVRMKIGTEMARSGVTEKGAFSLVELLVVIGIIAMLAALLLPALQKAKAMALTTQCASNQRQCGVALSGYASDFDGWVLGGECGSGALFTTLGMMMMGFNYAPYRGSFNGTPPTYGFCDIPFGAIFQCPALPPPARYHDVGRDYPSGELNSNTLQSYGLRRFDSHRYYAGEKVAPDPLLFIKLDSLYQPSRLPYMVDNCNLAYDSAGTEVGKKQCCNWYLDGLSYAKLHLRHNRRANVWMPDGHVGSWAAADTAEFKAPWDTVPYATFAYFY